MRGRGCAAQVEVEGEVEGEVEDEDEGWRLRTRVGG
jgi:hypothetical protein